MRAAAVSGRLLVVRMWAAQWPLALLAAGNACGLGTFWGDDLTGE